MTIKDLQTEMIAAMKAKEKNRKEHNLRANCRR